MKKHEKRLVSLISGGIDSPVATYLMLRLGAELILVHMDNRPFIDERPIEKVKKLAAVLAKKAGKGLKLYLVPQGRSQHEIVKNCPRKLTCVLCRRAMYRAAEAIAIKEGAWGIVTGENLGQVASQTLDNLAAEDSAISIPVHRPLIGFDKEDTIRIAKKIGTYDISILPGECCSMVPPYPETHAKLSEIEAAEKKLDIGGMVKKAVDSAELLAISSTE